MILCVLSIAYQLIPSKTHNHLDEMMCTDQCLTIEIKFKHFMNILKKWCNKLYFIYGLWIEFQKRVTNN